MVKVRGGEDQSEGGEGEVHRDDGVGGDFGVDMGRGGEGEGAVWVWVGEMRVFLGWGIECQYCVRKC